MYMYRYESGAGGTVMAKGGIKRVQKFTGKELFFSEQGTYVTYIT